MEVVQSENIKIQNAVLVSGLTNTELDKEALSFLEQRGPVARMVKVPSAEEGLKVIIEFQHEATARELERQLPLRRTTTDPGVVHHIQSLASVYSTEVSASATVAYLTELRDLARRSSRSFEDILRTELARMGESVRKEAEANVTETPAEPEPLSPPEERQDTSPVSPAIGHASPVSVTPQLAETASDTVLLQERRIQSPQVPADLISTPEVQRVIVEHIVKSSDVASHSNLSYKLKPFSGRVPHPAFEVDYDAWRSSVEFCINDPTISDTQVVRKISLTASSQRGEITRPNSYI